MSKRHFGSVRRRSSGRWQATYRHDGRVHNASQMFATKSDALAFLSITEADIHRGAWIDPRAGKVSVKDYANEWLARRPDLAVRTTELYRYLLDSYILPELGSSTLTALAPSKVRGWHAKLAQAHASTAAKAYRLLSTGRPHDGRSAARSVPPPGSELIKAPKSRAGSRVLAVPANVSPALQDHLDRYVGPEPDALVFTGLRGGPVTKVVLQRTWERARAKVGRTDLRIHDLRHTGLTLAAATGATTAELMHRAGHASPQAALRYQHATKDRDRVLADALAELATPAKVVPIKSARNSGSRPNRAQESARAPS